MCYCDCYRPNDIIGEKLPITTDKTDIDSDIFCTQQNRINLSARVVLKKALG